MVRIAVRVDGGISIGMGHVMRCLSLAKALRKAGYVVCFFSKNQMGINVIESEGFDVIRLSPEQQEGTEFFYGNSELLLDEAKDMIPLLHQYQIDMLVVDSYNITNQYFLTLKRHIRRLIYIDDENTSTYPVDVIINGNVTAEYLEYQRYDDEQLLLLGPKYNMIRDEFNNIHPRDSKENVEEIMITTGGSDPYSMSEKLLRIFLENEYFRKIRFNVLVGGGFTKRSELIHLSQNHDQIVLYSNAGSVVSDVIKYTTVSEMMLRSDMAISAGGSTLYEFAACGIPTVAFIMAQNQSFLVEKMAQLGYVMSLGWYNQISDDQIVDSTRGLMNDYSVRTKMSAKCRQLIDTLGTERIVKALS